MNDIKITTKLNNDIKNYYVFIENYVFYKNEKKYLQTNRRNSNIKLKNEKSKKNLCYKSIKKNSKKISLSIDK